MRHTPAQKRSSSKVEEILSATEALLLTTPLEDITTKMIADRAGVTRTSMYHFFPSKIDVFDALTERYYTQLQEEIVAFFDPNSRQEYHRAWIGVSAVYKQFFQKTPAAAVLLLGRKGAKQAIFGDSVSEEKLANNISALMAQHTNLPDVMKGDPPAPDFFQFILRLMRSLFSAGVRKEGLISPKIEQEVRTATIAYIDASLRNRGP